MATLNPGSVRIGAWKTLYKKGGVAMKRAYQIIEKGDREKLFGFLVKHGQLLLPIVELIEQPARPDPKPGILTFKRGYFNDQGAFLLGQWPSLLLR